MATPSNSAVLKLIDELRDAWTSDPRRAAEILNELQNALHGRTSDRGWAIARRERLQREHKELEQREREQRESEVREPDADGQDARGVDQ
ncbi:MAG TPA: hypothetical protein VFZ72_22965 [Jiangellaceae bacterium]